MGEELEVDDLVGVRLAVGQVCRRQIGELLLVECVLGIVVAEVILQRMERIPLLLAVGGVRHRPAALVIHPTAIAVGRPVGDGAAGQFIPIDSFKLFQSQPCVLQAVLRSVFQGNAFRLDDQLVGLLHIGIHRQSVDLHLPKLPRVTRDRMAHFHPLRRGYHAEVNILLRHRRHTQCQQQYNYNTFHFKQFKYRRMVSSMPR